MDPLAVRVAHRFLANVVPFRGPKKKSGVPTIEIGGHHYVLSTDGGPLGDASDPDDHGIMGYGDSGGARIIRGPANGNPWRYLWAYDTDRQHLGMWRASDGNEKFFGSARSETSRIVRLDKKGELNRVSSSQMEAITGEMRRRENDLLKSLKDAVEKNKSDFDREVGKLAEEFFEHHGKSRLIRAIEDVNKGVTPLGFKPHGPGEHDEAARDRQLVAFVIGNVFRRELSKDRFEKFVTQKGLDPMTDLQAVHWALDEVYEKVLEQYLPPRV